MIKETYDLLRKIEYYVNNMKRGMMYSLTIVIGSIVLFSAFGTVVAVKPEKDTYNCNLVHGEYLDVDCDGMEDDLRIIAELNHVGPDKKGTLNIFMYMSVEFPSGAVIDFAWKLTVYVLKDFTFEYHVIDGVLEPGWYTCELFIAVDGLDLWDDNSIIVFDPPIKMGNGDPSCDVLIY